MLSTVNNLIEYSYTCILTMAPPILQQPKPPSHHLDPLSPPVTSRVASVAILMTGQGISLIGHARLVEPALEEPAPLLIIHWEPDLVGFFLQITDNCLI